MNIGEEHLYKWQHGMLGDFMKALFTAICRADGDNMQKLEKAFPEEVEAYRRFSEEAGYWDKIKDEYANNIGKNNNET